MIFKYLLLITLFFGCQESHNQDYSKVAIPTTEKMQDDKEYKPQEKSAFEKIKDFHKKNAVIKEDIFLNQYSQILSIGNFQIPLLKVEVSYSLIPEGELSHHFVAFECEGIKSQCIKTDSGKTLEGMYMPLKSKEDCYDFIAMLDELKQNL